MVFTLPKPREKRASKKQSHPAAFDAKVRIRQLVLSAIPEPRVFDAFAGEGGMFRAVWSQAKEYVGCDLEWRKDGRKMFVGDNRRVLRAVELERFNIFDLDAFGSPWEQAIIIADRRPVAAGELIGIVITEGVAMSLAGNQMPMAMRELASLPGRNMVGQRRAAELVYERVIAGLAKRMGCKIERRWEARGKTGAHLRYTGLVLKGSEGLRPRVRELAEELAVE
jgi:hypothetical protein